MCDKQMTITALVCPQCGGPLQMTDRTCPTCKTGVVIDYAAIMGIVDYRITARHLALDAALLAILREKAAEKGIEVVTSICKQSILIYVRDIETHQLRYCGEIRSYYDEDDMYYYVEGGQEEDLELYIHYERNLKGGNVYALTNYGKSQYKAWAAGEEELWRNPKVLEWVQVCLAAAAPAPAPEPTKKWYEVMSRWSFR